jgi:hypothetical protein
VTNLKGNLGWEICDDALGPSYESYKFLGVIY